MQTQMAKVDILNEAKVFVEQHIRPVATRIDEAGAVPKELIEAFAAKGYLAASIPEEYGGLGLDPVSYGLLTEEVGKACCAMRTLMTVQTSLICQTLLRYGSDEQKNFWLTRVASGKLLGAFALSEPSVGSDAAAIATRYKKENDNYVINGKKKWISFAGIADFYIVISNSDEGPGAFIIDRYTKGVNTKPITGLLAGRATAIAEIEFENVRVPSANLLGKIGAGITEIVANALDEGRFSVAWGGLGIAQAALEAMVDYTRERKQFGEKLYTYQLIKGIMGDAVTDIHAARALCLRAAHLRKGGHPDAVIETGLAKYYTSKMAMSITQNAVQVHGGNGCCNEYVVERLFREAKLLEIIEGSSQIQVQVAANYALRTYSKNRRIANAPNEWWG